MAIDFNGLLVDLQAETQVVDAMISDLDDAKWACGTPAEGWTIRDQVTHLSYFDDITVLSASDPDRFRLAEEELATHGPDFSAYVATEYRTLLPAERLEWFRRSRSQLIESFSVLDPRRRLPWFGPDMNVASSATARLMETWAHGQDIADALHVDHFPTSRLSHIAHLGVRTFGFAFALHGLKVPTTPPRVELVAPDGSTWSWGDQDAPDLVSGTALDFCLVVTQRRHLLDTSLTARGSAATEWLLVAQAFAGPPGTGRKPASGSGPTAASESTLRRGGEA